MFVLANLPSPTSKLAGLAIVAVGAALTLGHSEAKAQWGTVTTSSWGASSSSSWSKGYGPNGYYNTQSKNSSWYQNESQSQFGYIPYGTSYGSGYGYGGSGYSVNTGGYTSQNSGYGYGPSGNWGYKNGSNGNYINGNKWNYAGW